MEINVNKIITIIIFFFSFINISLSQHCKDFRNGKFKLQDNQLGVTYIIERKGNIQTERKIGENFTLDFEVKWIDECTYKLKTTKRTAKFLKTDYELVVEIKKINGVFLELEMHMKNDPSTKLTTIVEQID